MGIISIRLNTKEESIFNYLLDHFQKDKSAFIKDILTEKYEDIQDLKIIKKFESLEKKKEIKFHTAEDVLDFLD